MKIVFAGSPDFSVPSLKRLAALGKVTAVVTQPDRPVGRKHILTPTPVKRAAQQLGLPVYDFPHIRDRAAELSALGADIMITCAYGQILTKEVLQTFPKGVWNLHASLLPKFRGASPIQSAILAGEEYTGITVMKTELALDSGDILLVKRIKIGDMTCGSLTKELSLLAADAAEQAVAFLERGEVQLLMQDEAKVTFCKKISKADCRLDFTQPSERVARAVKAFSPEPCAFCNLNGSPINILDCERINLSGRAGEVICADKRGIAVACGSGSILITSLQPAGGKAMPARDFVNGRKIKVGDVLD